MSLRLATVLSLFIGLLFWGALAALIYLRPPDTPQVGLAFVLLIAAITTSTAPLWGRIQQRVTPDIAPESLKSTAVRQGLWSGLLAVVLILFQLFGLLDWILVLVLMVLFVMLETFLQQRQQWRKTRKPAQPRAPASSEVVQKQRTQKSKGKGKKAGRK